MAVSFLASSLNGSVTASAFPNASSDGLQVSLNVLGGEAMGEGDQDAPRPLAAVLTICMLAARCRCP